MGGIIFFFFFSFIIDKNIIFASNFMSNGQNTIRVSREYLQKSDGRVRDEGTGEESR